MINHRPPGEETAPNDSHDESLPGQRQLGDSEPQAEQPGDPERPPQPDGQLR